MRGWIILALGIVIILAFIYRRRINRFVNLLMSKYKYFTYSEFDSPDSPGSGEKHMSKEFIRRLDAARGATISKEFPDGVPFVVVKGGGYRTKAYNTQINGAKTSAHMAGLAADIDYTTEAEKIAILKALRKLDFKRFGIRTGASGSSIHVDADPTKSQYVVWGYGGVPPTPNPFTLG